MAVFRWLVMAVFSFISGVAFVYGCIEGNTYHTSLAVLWFTICIASMGAVYYVSEQ